MGEEALIRRCQAGDRQAFEALFRTYLQKAVSTAYLITRDWNLAEDAAQEAFSRAFRSIRTFRVGQPFGPWLYRIVVNEARRAAGRNARPLPYLDLPVAAPSAEETVLTRERSAQVWQAIHALDESHRLVVVLKYFNGFSELETAQILGLRQSTVKSRLHVARQRLQMLLQRSEGV